MKFRPEFITKEPAATKQQRRNQETEYKARRWVEKRRVLGSNPGVDKTWEVFLVVAGSCQGAFATEVPLSKVPNLQMLTLGPAVSWRLIKVCTLPSPLQLE